MPGTDTSPGLRKIAKGNRGFALVTVVWGIGIISLLIITFMTTARWRIQAAVNISGATAAASLAEAAANVGIFRLLTEANIANPSQRSSYSGEPRVCSLQGLPALILVEDEGGKIDINSAPRELLQIIFMGLGVGMRDADRLAAAIIKFRGTGSDRGADAGFAENSGERIGGVKPTPFKTIFELDQVDGIDPSLFRALLPYVTIYSQSAGLDPSTAPPALFAMLSGAQPDDVRVLASHPYPNRLDRSDPRFPSKYKQGTTGAVFLIHAEVALPSGVTGTHELVVDLRSQREGEFVVKEKRHGSARFTHELKSLQERRTPLSNC